MGKRIALIIISLGLVTGFGQDLETDRPDQTESSNTIPKGTFQIESGMGVELTTTGAYGSPNVSRSFTVPTSLFRIALTDFLEARFVNTLRRNSTQSSGGFVTGKSWQIDDLQVGAKIRFFKGDGWKPQIGLMSHVLMPVGSEYQNRFGVINKLLISHDFKNGMSLGYNLGYNYLGKGTGDFNYSISLAFPVTERIGVYIEAYTLDAFYTPSHADAGFTFMLKDNIQLDYSFGLGITNRSNYQAIGISIRMPK